MQHPGGCGADNSATLLDTDTTTAGAGAGSGVGAYTVPITTKTTKTRPVPDHEKAACNLDHLIYRQSMDVMCFRVLKVGRSSVI